MWAGHGAVHAEEGPLELTQGHHLATPRRLDNLRFPRADDGVGEGQHAWAVAWIAVSLAPFVGILCFILLKPRASADSLILPVGVLACLTALLTTVGTFTLRQRQQRSILFLHRLARRVLARDLVGDPQVAFPLAADLQPLADDLKQLGNELESARTTLERTTRELRVAQDNRQGLVSALAIANTRLRQEATIVHDFVATVNRPLDREQMCLQLLHALDDEVPYQLALIYLTDESEQLCLAAVSDRERNYRQAGRFVRNVSTYSFEVGNPRSLPNLVCHTGKPIIVSDAHLDRRFVGLPDNLRSYLAVPIDVNSRVIGALQVCDAPIGRYDAHDERQIATLAHFAALWIENVRLFQEAAQVEALRKVDQLKSELISTVSHELRTPLASIKGYTSSLLREDVEWDANTRREFLQIIDEESDRLTSLIEDVLQMSEIEAGVLRVTRQPVKISRLAQKVVKKLRPQSRDRSLTVASVGEIPDTMADPRRIEQVLHNLVVNALKYSPDGAPVAVRLERRGLMIHVSVKDQGIGIAPEHAERVFERFYRVEGTLSRQTGGSGLGLSICRGLVEAHGGRIWVESQPTKGSTFCFTIPIVVVEERLADAEDRDLLALASAEE
jgi:signal transduction histidine kinase